VNVDNAILHALNGFFFQHDAVEDTVVAYVNAGELLFLGALLVTFSLVRGPARRGARRAVVAAGLSAGLGLALAQFIAFAGVLAVGRVAMGVHYPSDVLGGAALGAACALVLWLPPVRRALNRLADFAGAVLDGVIRRPSTHP
jgi:membrane-associated phospholipid phosphatase